MRKFLTTIMSMAMLLGSGIAYAQPSGDYGSGIDGSPTISTTFYADAQRAEVTNISGAVINITNASGTTIPIDDYVIVIQMEGTNVGHFQFERVQDNTTTGEYTFYNSLSGFTTGSGNVVQVIHVYEFQSPTISSGGNVTCAAYDGSTGGIVCFFARGKLTITGTGKVDASGKGYEGTYGANGGSAGVAAGSYGTGQTTTGGNASGSTISETGSVGYGITDNSSTCTNPAHRGGSGTDQVAGGGASSATPVTIYGDPTFKSNIIMGDGGTGGDGGKGPNAGGNGGGGAGNGSSSGSDGSMGGNASGTGGDGGYGGRGGGAIYLRLNQIDASGVSGRIAFFCNGDDGGVGASGGTGGQGAPGGAGANGACPNLPAGGAGGIGYRGDGGDGGDGGAGGDAGLIWVAYSGTITSVSITQTFQAEGGSGGAGGSGGGVAPKIYFTQLPNIMDLSAGACTYNQGGAYHYCDDTEEIEDCDCDEVFCRMIDMTNTPTGFHDFELDGDNYGFWDNPGGGQPATLWVYAVTSSGGTSTKPAMVTTTKYRCEVDNSTAQGYVSQVVNDLASGTPPTTSCVDNGTEKIVSFNNGANTYTYTHDYYATPNTYTINQDGGTEYGIDNTCSTMLECAGDCPEEGDDGTGGSVGDDGKASHLGDDVELFYEPCNTCMSIPVKQGKDDPDKQQETKDQAENSLSTSDDLVNELGVTLYPNPSSSVVNFSFSSDEGSSDVEIVINDMSGKQVLIHSAEAKAGANTITVDITSLAAGNYIANIRCNGKLSQIKFVVQK